MALSPQQLQLLESVRRVAREELRPLADRGEPGKVNHPLVRGLGESGLLARLFPEASRVSATELCLLRHGLARECTEAETALALQGLGAHPIFAEGPPELAGRWIPAVVKGEAVAAFALTEPGAGSDVAGIELIAEPDGQTFRLTGEKAYISNAPEADIYTVFARTTPGAGAKGITAFLVPGDAVGLQGEVIHLLSPHPIGRLTFDGVRVPGEHLLGRPEGGFGVAMRTLDLFRPSVGAFAVGMSEAALERAVEHASSRRAFGRTIAELQGISHQLAEMATRTEAARLLVYEAAAAYDAGQKERITALAAKAKLFATETAQYVVDAAIQVHGARALEESHLLAHLYREVRATRIYEGTSEIQRNIIARELLKEGLAPPYTPQGEG